MNWDAIGAIAETVGAIGVIASLVYLAAQIRQNSRIGRLNAHQAISDSIARSMDPIFTDPELHRIWRKAGEHPEELTSEERERFGMFLYSLFGTFYNAHLFADLDSAIHGRYERLVDRYLSSPAVRAWWQRQAQTFDPAFVRIIEERLRRITVQPKDRPAA